MHTRWNYKGLICNIENTDSGCVYSVLDVTLVTRDYHLFLYGGSKESFSKKDIEEKIDIKLKNNNIRIANQCQYLVNSYKQGHCAFANCNCDDYSCPCYRNGEPIYTKPEVEDMVEDSKETWYEELKDKWVDSLEEVLKDFNLNDDEIDDITEKLE